MIKIKVVNQENKKTLLKCLSAAGLIFITSLFSLIILNITGIKGDSAANIKILLMPLVCIPITSAVLVRKHKINIKSFFRLGEINWNTAAYVIVSITILVSISFVLGLLFPNKSDFEINGNIIIYGISACIVAPISEEFLYRGILCSERTRFSAVLSAILFSAVHISPIDIPFYIVLSLLNTYAICKFEGIFAPIVIHSLSNMIMLSFFLFF